MYNKNENNKNSLLVSYQLLSSNVMSILNIHEEPHNKINNHNKHQIVNNLTQ